MNEKTIWILECYAARDYEDDVPVFEMAYTDYDLAMRTMEYAEEACKQLTNVYWKLRDVECDDPNIDAFLDEILHDPSMDRNDEDDWTEEDEEDSARLSPNDKNDPFFQPKE